MPSASTLVLFCSAALVLLVIPGPSVLYIVTRSIDQGQRAGLVSVLGTHAGSLVHIAAAAFGLSALIVSSALAFSAVKYLGAAYLVWLGIRRWRAGDLGGFGAERSPMATAHLFRQGFVVSTLNPKTAIFFLAFLPQFVDPDRGAVTAQVLVLGLAFIGGSRLSDSTYAIAGSRLGALLRRSGARRTERYVSSGVYVGLGLTTAVAGGHATASS
ncbi:MAG: LysE family translocator [Acidimicrobiia bacterium]|nr:LysE family translocator [Acidimicrobiia bacterium]